MCTPFDFDSPLNSTSQSDFERVPKLLHSISVDALSLSHLLADSTRFSGRDADTARAFTTSITAMALKIRLLLQAPTESGQARFDVDDRHEQDFLTQLTELPEQQQPPLPPLALNSLASAAASTQSPVAQSMAASGENDSSQTGFHSATVLGNTTQTRHEVFPQLVSFAAPPSPEPQLANDLPPFRTMPTRRLTYTAAPARSPTFTATIHSARRHDITSSLRKVRNIPKKRNGNLPKTATAIFRAWLESHLQHPYPTEKEKAALSVRSGVSLVRVTNWFTNARRRYIPQATTNATPQGLPATSDAHDKVAKGDTHAS